MWDVWNVLFLVCTSAGAVVWLKRWTGLRWVAASIPFLAMSDAASWTTLAGFTLAIGGLILAAVGPTLPGRRRRSDGSPMPHLASGPLVPIEPRVYPMARRSRPLEILTIMTSGLVLLLAGATLFAKDPDAQAVFGALSLASLIISVTFAFSLWFSQRLQLRIDEHGLHSRVIVGEHSIPWKEVSEISLRYVFLQGGAVRVVYYVVRSPTHEFAFPSSMSGAKDLQSAIERATGLQWLAPEIQPNF